MRRLRQAAEAEALNAAHDDHNNNLSIPSLNRRTIKLRRNLFRPFREILILNRNNFFRLLAVLAFFSGMSTSGDQTLILYYVQQQFNFSDQDVAIFFVIIGLLGITVQVFGLHLMTEWLGEKIVVVVAFFFGAFHNCIYAFAATKLDIFLAAGIGSVTMMAFPTISAIKANNVNECEQGRIQGALLAVSSLASAIGPITLRLTYEKTRGTKYPGSFFLVATLFYLVATLCATTLPNDQTNSLNQEQERIKETNCSERSLLIS